MPERQVVAGRGRAGVGQQALRADDAIAGGTVRRRHAAVGTVGGAAVERDDGRLGQVRHQRHLARRRCQSQPAALQLTLVIY